MNKRPQVFGKAVTSKADAGFEKPRTDAWIHAEPGGDLGDICTDHLAKIGNHVNERDLHRQERVGGMLDDFSGAQTGDQDGSIERSVDFLKDRFSACGFNPTNHPVGIEEVFDRNSFLKEFRVGGDIKRDFTYRAVAVAGSFRVTQECALHPFGGDCRHGTFLHDEFVAVEVQRNGASDGLYLRQVSLAVFTLRGAHTNEEDGGVADRCLEVVHGNEVV